MKITTLLTRRRFVIAASSLLAAALGPVLGLVGGAVAPQGASAQAQRIVYADGLAAGWSNWSWSTLIEQTSSSPVSTGTAALAATVQQPWGALSLRTDSPAPFGPGSTLTFALHGGPSGTSLSVTTGNDDANSSVSTAVGVSAPANTWTTWTLSAEQLVGVDRVARINIGANPPGSTTGRFSLDDVRISSGTVGTTVPTVADGTIRVDATGPATPFTARQFGTNLPFFVGGDDYRDPVLQRRLAEATRFVRYPGSQVSQEWGWASCELRQQVPGALACGTTRDLSWVARPSDLLAYATATGSEVVIGVNINATAKENAAFVAFLNGATTDQTVIGVDARGANWGTVGSWAQRRAAAGFAAPIGVRLWEFGNETYGGKAGDLGCVSYGWEETWTCDAGQYLRGIGSGPTGYDGYLAQRVAMRAVDPGILIGAPALGREDFSGQYGDWTQRLMRDGAGQIDFLVVHPYFTFTPPPNTPAGNAEILSFPQTQWPAVRANIDQIAAAAGVPRPPLLVSEFNLTPVTSQDPARRINGMGNALVQTDSYGVMALTPGFLGANGFDGFGPPQADGSWFSMVRDDAARTRMPTYWGSYFWRRVGPSLVPVTTSYDSRSTLSVYAGRPDGQTVTVYVLNKSGARRTADVTVTGVSGLARATIDQAVGDSFADESLTVNGSDNPSDDPSDAPPVVRDLDGSQTLRQTFAPWSMTLVRLTIGPGTPTTTRLPTTTTRPPTTTTTTTTVPGPTTSTTRPPTTTTTTTLGPTTTTAPGPTTTTAPGPTTTTVPSPPWTCRVVQNVFWDNGSGYGAYLSITNLGPALDGWTLTWRFAGNEVVTSSWSGTVTAVGPAATAVPTWNRSLPSQGSTEVGFSVQTSGPARPIADVRLNGLPCA